VTVSDTNGQQVTSFLAYEETFTGGVRVAVADLNGDGTLDIVTGAGPGGGPRVRAFDGATGATLLDFMAYETSFTGGVFVAAGPIGDGQIGIATGADATGGPRVRVFAADGTSLQDFFAFDQSFTGGVRVALGQTGSGTRVYAAPGDGLDPTVRGFDIGTGSQVFEQAAGTAGTTGGTLVAAGDLDADGADDIFTAVSTNGWTELRAFSGADGMYMHHSQVDGSADGLAVVNWSGQRAVGVLGGGYLTAYALASGTEVTPLGQLDASQSGGAGASLGATPGGGTAGGLGAGAQKTLEADWLFNVTPVEKVHVTSKVTLGLPGYPDKYKWEYHLHNNDFDEVVQPGTGVAHFVIYTPVSDKIIEPEMGSSRNWSHQIGEAGDDTVVKWSGAPDILPGEDADFWFTTPALPINYDGWGDARDGGEANRPAGKALVPWKLPSVKINATDTLIPVNADNDNGSPWKSADQPFIPSKRDFDPTATNLPRDDLELRMISVTVWTWGLAGTLTVSNYNPGEGCLSFWKDAKKKNGFQSVFIPAGIVMNPTIKFYVEGTHESQSADDTFVDAVFTSTDNPLVSASDRKALTVTPVINSFTKSIPTPSVSFKNRTDPPNGLKGIIAQKYSDQVGGQSTPGITFNAEVVNGGLPMTYVQEWRSLINGYNEDGAAVKLVNPDSQRIFVIKDGVQANWPLLDTAPPGTNPSYALTTVTNLQTTPASVKVSANDSPDFGFQDPATNERISLIDFKDLLRIYLVVRYSRDQSIYPIAFWNWGVNFYATNRVANKGLTVINDASKVTADDNYTRLNLDPEKTKPPVGNGSIDLVEV
jgi:hypothetical protein